jgi:hypothetical protein
MNRFVLATLGGALVLLSFAGCIPILDKTYTTPSDTSAAHLSMNFVARVNDASSWTASDSFAAGKTSVRFAKGEQVACDGVALNYSSEDGYFSKTLPLKPHGTSYVCTYTSGKEVTSWQFELPDVVKVTAPQAGDTVDRKNVTIRYTGSTGVGISVEADNGDHTPIFIVSNPTQDAPGIYQFSVPPPMPAGAGRLTVHSIRQETAAGFADAQIYEDAGAVVIPITWT